jgi:hypothetical protein
MVDDFVCVFQCLDIFDVQLVNGENLLFDFHGDYLSFFCTIIIPQIFYFVKYYFRPPGAKCVVAHALAHKERYIMKGENYRMECQVLYFAEKILGENLGGVLYRT